MWWRYWNLKGYGLHKTNDGHFSYHRDQDFCRSMCCLTKLNYPNCLKCCELYLSFKGNNPDCEWMPGSIWVWFLRLDKRWYWTNLVIRCTCYYYILYYECNCYGRHEDVRNWVPFCNLILHKRICFRNQSWMYEGCNAHLPRS